MLCRPMWPFLFMYGSHDMRHTGFPQVDGGQRDPWVMGRHSHDMVFKLQAVSWSRHSIFMSRQCLLLCCDNVATKDFMSRPR